MSNRVGLILLTAGLLLIDVCASGQAAQSVLPCSFDGPLLRDAQGALVRFTSNDMKQRATSKEDLKGFIKQVDFKSMMLIEILVSESGDVVCTRTISGIPMARQATEEAVRKWKFKVANMAGKRVAYVGWLEFSLCNIDCANDEFGVTLLK